MDIYKLCLYLGFTGLAAMALLGAAHMGDHGTHVGGTHVGGTHDFNLPHGGHAHGAGGGFHHHAEMSHGGVAGHGGHAVHHGAHHGHSHDGGARGLSGRIDVYALLSPRVWFSILLGFGAVGLLLKGVLPVEPWRFAVAAGGGLMFEAALMKPIWNGWMKFASKPARTLESAVAEEARAITNFDADGHGLVLIDLDGHEMQVLARLTEAQRVEGVRVRARDLMFVEDVDAARNRCTVSRLER